MTEFLTTLATIALVVIVFTLIVELFNFIYALTKLAEKFLLVVEVFVSNEVKAKALLHLITDAVQHGDITVPKPLGEALKAMATDKRDK